MMTTNKNQRTTHIDDVVKYQPRPFFFCCSVLFIVRYATFSTIIYACILYSQMKMMKLLTLTLLLCAHERAYSHSLSLPLSFFVCVYIFLIHSISYSVCFIFEFVFHHFLHRLLLNIFFRHTLFHPIVRFAQNYVSRQWKKKI